MGQALALRHLSSKALLPSNAGVNKGATGPGSGGRCWALGHILSGKGLQEGVRPEEMVGQTVPPHYLPSLLLWAQTSPLLPMEDLPPSPLSASLSPPSQQSGRGCSLQKQGPA